MTLHYLDESSSSADIYSFLADEIKDWFTSKFPGGFTLPQLYAIPSIHNRKNTLVFSSTGSGKTFAAFLSAINELFIEAKEGNLKDEIYVLYISPLKALGNDIRKNLEEPLQGIQELAASNNLVTPKIRVGVRTGDTTQAERTKMLKTPPHILITTPESLGLILTSPKFSLHLKSVRWLVLDEIHEVSSNKRGVMLSLFLSYLQQEVAENEITRIGLSATQAPIEEIARFLVGNKDSSQENDCFIANLPPQRKLDLEVKSPVNDLIHTPYVIIQEGIYAILADLILDHETSIVFTNTRRGAENVAFRLKEYLGDEYASSIAVHHSSLSREIRLDVEDRLKNNELLAAITSTSLELGIDIGSVELVSQIGSPKTVAKYLQRVGRSGHSLDRIAKGRLITTDRDDAIECAVLTKSAYSREIDKVQIPINCLDVLAQFIVGISLMKRWGVEEAFDMIRKSYNYKTLDFNDFINVLEYLGGYNLDVEERKIYRKIWYDDKEKAFGKKRGSRLIFYTNIGTIPENADYRVELETYRTRIGVLSESFVERLTPGDIFVLGSHTYQFRRTVGSRVVVAEAFGRRPTIPNWVGEELPRSFELSQQIGRFIDAVSKKIQKQDESQVRDWIERSFQVDDIISKSIVEYVKEQMMFLNVTPSDKKLLIESYIDPQGRMVLVFHAYYGRRVNDALSRAYAYTIGKAIDSDIGSAVNDNGFLLMLPIDKIIDTSIVPELLSAANLEEILKQAIINTELFVNRFRHVANRAFMVLRRSGQKHISVSRQSMYAKRIFSTLRDQDSFCVIKETYREILKDYMDLVNSLIVLSKLQKGEFEFHITPLSDIPSPFAHGIVLMGISDIVQISDRSALLRELHQQVLAKVFGKEGSKEILFNTELVERIFNNRSYKNTDLPISSLKQLKSAVKALAPIKTTDSVNPSIYHHSISDAKQIRAWSLALHNSRELIEVHIAKGERRSIPITDFQLFWNLYLKSIDKTELDEKILKLINDVHPISLNKIAEELKEETRTVQIHLEKLESAMLIARVEYELYGGRIRSKLAPISEVVPEPLLREAKKLDPEECLKKIILRFLKVHGPSTMHQITDYLRIEEEKLVRALAELEQKSRILKGRITESSTDLQYIRLEDRELLRNLSNRKPDSIILTPEDLNYMHYSFAVESIFDENLQGKESVLNLLNRFGSIEDLSSLSVRINDFDLDWIRDLIEKNELIKGRFSHKRLSFVSREMFPYYYVAYREPFNLSRVDEKILSTIRKYGPLTKREIIEFTEMDGDIIQESLTILDKTLYLVRKSVSQESFIPKQFVPNVYEMSERYFAVDKLPSFEKSQEFILLQAVESLGPVSLVELTHLIGFRYSNIEKLIKNLLSKKKIIERKLTERETNYYMTPERFKDIGQIKNNLINMALKEEERIVILPKNDPFTRLGMRLHLRDTYGEGQIDPILLDGEMVGSVEYKLHRGQYLQIYDLKLKDEVAFHSITLQKIASELVSYIRKIHRVLSLQIEDINGKSVLSKSNNFIKTTLVKTGFKLIKDTLVGGDTVTKVFPERVINKYIMESLWLKKKTPSLTVETLLQMINHFSFISLREILSRFPENMSSIIVYLLNTLLEDKEVICQGNVFLSLDFALYKKSGLRRRKRMNTEIEETYRNIQKGSTNQVELSKKWKGATSSLKSALSTLEENMKIGVRSLNNLFEPQEYWDIEPFLVELKKDIAEIRKEYIFDILCGLGVATEDHIAERGVIPGVLTKIRIKEVLAALIDEDKIYGGRFVENDLQFYYISTNDYDKLLQLEKKEESKVDYSPKEVRERYYLLYPKDLAINILRNQLPGHFDVSTNNYIVVLNQKVAAQCYTEQLNQRTLAIKNLLLAPWIHSESSLNYVVNAIEDIPSFDNLEIKSLVVEKINGIPTNTLVK
ncbi:MAG: ATP-dependent helicase [Candidatus Heimdallarchaeaceae archaeon]